MVLFLSYRRADSRDVVGRIYDRLITHFPIEAVYRDLDSLLSTAIARLRETEVPPACRSSTLRRAFHAAPRWPSRSIAGSSNGRAHENAGPAIHHGTKNAQLAQIQIGDLSEQGFHADPSVVSAGAFLSESFINQESSVQKRTFMKL